LVRRHRLRDRHRGGQPPDYQIFIDINDDGDDARLDVTNWQQTITGIDGVGNVTSIGSGSVVCTIVGGIGELVCPSVAPTVLGWPPQSGDLPSSAVINPGAETITVVDNSVSAAGTISQFFSYNASSQLAPRRRWAWPCWPG
jgi:hypothetical protein